MVDNAFRKGAANVRGSAKIIPIFLAFVLLLIIGSGLWWEDYQTSRLGYDALPTRKYGDYVPMLAAAVPQVLQVVAAYIFGTNTRNKKYLVIFMIALLADVGTDAVFKIDGNFALLPIALAENLIFFTIGSEFAIVISVGYGLELLPDFLEACARLAARLADVWERLESKLDSDEEVIESHISRSSRSRPRVRQGGHPGRGAEEM